MAEKKKKQFLNNKDFYNEIVKSKEQNELTVTAQKMLILLVKRASTKLLYIDPEDRKDCIAMAYLDVFKYWRSFKPEYSTNAFAYYTEIIKKGFAKAWNVSHPKKYAGTISLDRSEDSDGIYSL